jgi:hypothetical protein
LIFALNWVSLPTSGRQKRHLAFISEYTNQLVYVPGRSNVIADGPWAIPPGGGCHWDRPGLRSHRRLSAPGSKGYGTLPDPLLTGTSSPLQPRPVHHHAEGRRPCPHRRLLHWHIPPAGTQRPSATGGQGVHPPAQTLHRPHCAAHSQGPPARHHLLLGFLGTVFPWPAARGFCTPRRRSRQCRRSACPQPPSANQIRPVGLRPRGLGEPYGDDF